MPSDSPASAPRGGERPGRSRWRVALVVTGAVLGLLALVGTSVALVVRDLEDNVERERVFDALDEADRPTDDPPVAGPRQPIDVLVLGSDSRDDPIGQDFQGEGDEHFEGERTDTTLLVRLNAERDAGWSVSIPRDSWVRLPACTGPDGEQLPPRDDLFANAFRDGGLACTVKTVESLTDVRIDHTVVVDFTGFTEMVNALDGVPVCLDEPFRPRRVDIELPAGRHVLHDREALEFVRARYGLGDGTDLGRIERQKEFMASMIDRARSRQLLVRPDRLVRFLSAATSSLRVDEDLDLRALALSLRGLEGERVVFSTVPLDPDPGPEFRDGGRLFGRVAWDEPAADELFTALRENRFPFEDPAEPAPGDDAAPPVETTTAADPCT
ncbi:MAG TPA: LCP family protein [Mycobacteriales bacterium]|nr:LCP family protein [Mycobacteriales bacterium]